MQVSSLARYAVVARLLSPAEFGIAALVAGAAQLAEIVSSAGADTILIQAPDGDEPRLQEAIHMQRAIRGAVNGLLLLLLAGPISAVLGLNECVNELRLLAAFPLIRGLYHTDCSRLQRGMQFKPWIVTEVVPNLFTTVVVIGLAATLRDHRAVVAGVLLQATAGLFLSHAVSERRYRWSYDRAAFRRYYSFSWPLVANSILLFAITQGDRFVIGSASRLLGNGALTLQEVGLYSSVATISMAPSLAIANVILSLGLPYLSEVQSDEGRFEKRFQRLLQWTLVFALCYFVPLALHGPVLISAIVGAQYAPVPQLVTAIAAAWAVRLIRAVPTVAALAKADTKNGLFSNLGRAAGLAGICIAVAVNGTLTTVAAIAAGAEIAATVISVVRLGRITHSAVLKSVPVLLAASAVTVFVLLMRSLTDSPLVTPPTLILVAVTLFLTCGSVRRDIHDALR